MLVFSLTAFLGLAAATEKCGSPPSIAHGALTLPALPQYESGSSVQYICSEHHFLQGSERILCSEGQWTLPPVCVGGCDEGDAAALVCQCNAQAEGRAWQ